MAEANPKPKDLDQDVDTSGEADKLEEVESPASTPSTVHNEENQELEEFFENEGTGFNPYTYTHVLAEGQEDHDDFTEEDLAKYPELGMSDTEVEKYRKQLSNSEQKLFDQIKKYAHVRYTQGGEVEAPGTDARIAVGERFPQFPSSTFSEQHELRAELEVERKKRKAEIQEGITQPRKIRRIVPTKIVDDFIHVIDEESSESEGEDGLVKKDEFGEIKEKKPLKIIIEPGINLNEQIEIDEVRDMITVGDTIPKEIIEIHADDDSDADTISNCSDKTTRSDLDAAKVKTIFQNMAGAYKTIAEGFNELAGMVETMDPVTLEEAVSQTPAPPNKIPREVVEFHEDYGSEELKRICTLGYLEQQTYKAGLKRKFDEKTEKEVCQMFGTSRHTIKRQRKAAAARKDKIRMDALVQYGYQPGVKKTKTEDDSKADTGEVLHPGPSQAPELASTSAAVEAPIDS